MSLQEPLQALRTADPEVTDETVTVEESSDADQVPATETAVPTLDTDSVFELLKNRRRRDILRYLDAHEGTVTMREVAEYVAARENGVEVKQVTSKQRKRVYVALYQCHLPMMHKAGVISFNRPRGIIDLEPAADQLRPYLVEPTPDDQGWRTYLGVTAFGGLLYLFGSLLVGPGSLFTSLVVVGLVGAIAALAIVQGSDALADLLPGGAEADTSLFGEPTLADPVSDD